MSTETRFKVGQQVKVIQKSNDYYGKTGKVTNDDGDDEDSYPYKVQFSDGDEDTYCQEHLASCPKTLRNLQEGDTVFNGEGNECTVMGVCGRAIFIDSGYGITNYTYTPEYLEKHGWKVKQQADDQVEMSVEEAEKKLGLKAGTLRIKAEDAA